MRITNIKVDHSIAKVFVSAPKVAEPVVVSANEIVLSGKAPGEGTLRVWDDSGNTLGIEAEVSKHRSRIGSAIKAFMHEIRRYALFEKDAPSIPPVVVGQLGIAEIANTQPPILTRVERPCFKRHFPR